MSIIYFQRLEDFPAIFLLLIFSLSELQYENILCIIYTLLNMWMCVLWPRICSTLVNVSCNLQKNAYPGLSGWSTPYMTITSIWLLLLVRSCLCLLKGMLAKSAVDRRGSVFSFLFLFVCFCLFILHLIMRFQKFLSQEGNKGSACMCMGWGCLFIE